jgi:hypothetical protein
MEFVVSTHTHFYAFPDFGLPSRAQSLKRNTTFLPPAAPTSRAYLDILLAAQLDSS